jgi:hypothetical protein
MDDLTLFENSTDPELSDLDKEIDVVVLSISASFALVLLFIVFCCCCSAKFAEYIDSAINSNTAGDSDNEYGRRALRRMEEEKEKAKEDPAVLRQRLLKSFDDNKVSMVITQESFVPDKLPSKKRSDSVHTDPTASSVSSDEDMEEGRGVGGKKTGFELGGSEHSSSDEEEDKRSDNGHCNDDGSQKKSDCTDTEKSTQIVTFDIEEGSKEIYLPTPDGGQRKITNGCAICLCEYDIDDTVVWSCNKECPHAFHDECILEWLVKNQNGDCPCCRGQFTNVVSKSKEKKDVSVSSSIRSWMESIQTRYTPVRQAD